METLKEVITYFAEQEGSLYSEYLETLDRNKGEILPWRKGFVKGYEYLCNQLIKHIDESNNKLITKDTILHLLRD